MADSSLLKEEGCRPLPEEARRQLDFLNRAEYHLNFVLAGILLRYQLFHNQRAMLLDSACCPETFDKDCYPSSFQIEVVSSLLVLYALFGFHRQAQDIACLVSQEGGCLEGENLEVFLSALVILVALIRLFQVLRENGENTPEQTPEEELLDIPDVP